MPLKVSDVAPGAAGQPSADTIPAAGLSEDQFAQLVELLTPGYELSKLYLAEYERHQSERDAAGIEAVNRMKVEREVADEKLAAEKKAAEDAAKKAADEAPKG